MISDVFIKAVLHNQFGNAQRNLTIVRKKWFMRNLDSVMSSTKYQQYVDLKFNLSKHDQTANERDTF
ncbi:hypothetical protein ACFL4B_01915 [Candidatus Neomarinimicrobiota bacterium]